MLRRLNLNMPKTDRIHWLLLWLGLPLLFVMLWDISLADQQIAHWYGSAKGFALENDYMQSHILHTRARQSGVLLGLACVLAIWWPLGPLRHTTRRERVWLASTVWLCAAGIALLKSTSHTSCPYDLKEFGGVASYVWHFALAQADGGPGRCFPSGHASTFFSFLPVFWLLLRYQPKRAWLVLGIICVLGMALSWVQVVRGAHYPSHILWTAWLCWAMSALASPWLQAAPDLDPKPA
jgi:membrane-associated PAP2 superfamily phosphatase